MNVLITGGSGRLAGYVAREFADHQLVLTDVRPPPDDRAHLPFVAADLTDFADCRRVIAESEPEAIVALGAIPYATDKAGRDGNGPPFDTTMRVNVLGLYYLLTAAAEAGVKKLVQTSSVVTMKGGAITYRYLPIDDDHPGCVTESYIFSKMAGEMMLQWFWRAYGIHSVGCRPAWIWTPEELQRHAQNIAPTSAWESGLWHYVDIRDVAHAHRLLFDALAAGRVLLRRRRRPPRPRGVRELIERLRRNWCIDLTGRQAFVSRQPGRRRLPAPPLLDRLALTHARRGTDRFVHEAFSLLDGIAYRPVFIHADRTRRSVPISAYHSAQRRLRGRRDRVRTH